MLGLTINMILCILRQEFSQEHIAICLFKHSFFSFFVPRRIYCALNVFRNFFHRILPFDLLYQTALFYLAIKFRTDQNMFKMYIHTYIYRIFVLSYFIFRHDLTPENISCFFVECHCSRERFLFVYFPRTPSSYRIVNIYT